MRFHHNNIGKHSTTRRSEVRNRRSVLVGESVDYSWRCRCFFDSQFCGYGKLSGCDRLRA